MHNGSLQTEMFCLSTVAIQPNKFHFITVRHIQVGSACVYVYYMLYPYQVRHMCICVCQYVHAWPSLITRVYRFSPHQHSHQMRQLQFHPAVALTWLTAIAAALLVLPDLAAGQTQTTCSSLPFCASCIPVATGLSCIQCSSPYFLFGTSCYASCGFFPGYRETVSGANRTCSPCPPGTFDASPSSGVRNCTNVSQCAAGQFSSTSPTVTSDRVCTDLSSVCPVGQYIVSLPVDGSTAACNPVSACQSPYVSFLSPTYTSDRVCAINTTQPCPVTMYEIGRQSALRFCADIHQCSVVQYEALSPSPTTDRMCATLSSCLTACTSGLAAIGYCSCAQHCFSCNYNSTLSYCTVCGDGYYLYQVLFIHHDSDGLL